MSTVAPAPQPRLTEPQRLINTFVAPSLTFTDIRKHTSWWVPWMLLSVVSLGFMFSIQRKIGFEQVVRNEIARSSRAEQFERLSPEQQQRQMQMTTKIMTVAGYASPVTALIVFLIIAAVLMGVFNFGAGAEVTFGQSMAIVVYGMLPSLLGSLLAIISVIIGVDPEGFNIKNPVATNPAYFMDPMQHKFLYGMASSLDVVIIWCIILLGIGYSSVSKLKKLTAIITIAGAYLAFKVIASAISAL